MKFICFSRFSFQTDTYNTYVRIVQSDVEVEICCLPTTHKIHRFRELASRTLDMTFRIQTN